MEVVRILCARGCERHFINKQGHSAIDLVRDVDIGAEIQSYDPIDEEDDLDDSTLPFPSIPPIAPEYAYKTYF